MKELKEKYLISHVSLHQSFLTTKKTHNTPTVRKNTELRVCTWEQCDPVLDLFGKSHFNSSPSQTLEVTFVHILNQLILPTYQDAMTRYKNLISFK